MAESCVVDVDWSSKGRDDVCNTLIGSQTLPNNLRSQQRKSPREAVPERAYLKCFVLYC